MVTSAATQPSGGSLWDAFTGKSQGAKPSTSASFGDQLSGALKDSLALLGVNAGQAQVQVEETKRQGDGVNAGERQFLVTFSAASAQPPSGSPDPTNLHKSTGATAPAASTAPPASDPVALVRQALTAIGTDFTALTFDLYDDTCTNPMGGQFVNRLMRVTLPNGHTESFDQTLTARNPMITATEIKRLLTLPPPATT